jgi:hypothetical protein
MASRLTDDEWQRIAEFANTPVYERSPEQLMPGDVEVEEDIDTGPSTDVDVDVEATFR